MNPYELVKKNIKKNFSKVKLVVNDPTIDYVESSFGKIVCPQIDCLSDDCEWRGNNGKECFKKVKEIFLIIERKRKLEKLLSHDA